MKIHFTYLLLLSTLLTSTLYGQLDLNTQNKLSLNSTLVTNSDFTIGIDNSLGGLMINTTDDSYVGIMGYSLNGVIKGYSGFDHIKDRYNIIVGGAFGIGITADATRVFNTLETGDLLLDDKLIVGNEMDPLFTIDANTNKMYFNYNQNVGLADFVLNTKMTTGYGGMFINSDDVVSGKPFYGYSIDGLSSAFHNYNKTDSNWHLFVNDIDLFKVGDNESRIGNDFLVGDFGDVIPALHIKTGLDRHMFFNTDTKISEEDFTLNSANQTGFGGMYVNSPSLNNGQPFYGYANGGNISAFHYYNSQNDTWHLSVDGNEILDITNDEVKINDDLIVEGIGQLAPTFHIENGVSKHMYYNTDSQIGSSDFSLNSDNSTGFGGMSINSEDSDSGRPFYGYAIGGILNSFHYFDAVDEYWKLTNIGTTILQANDEELIVEGSVRVSNKALGVTSAGTIYYNGNHFYGITENGAIKLLDNTTNLNESPDNKNFSNAKVTKLENQNKLLTKKVQILEARLSQIESLLANKGLQK